MTRAVCDHDSPPGIRQEVRPVMTAAELRCAREYLGLTNAWMANHLGLAHTRKLARMESGQEPITDESAGRVADVYRHTDAAVARLADEIAASSGDRYRVYAHDGDYRRSLGPDAGELDLSLPASWHRMVAARALDRFVASDRPRLLFAGEWDADLDAVLMSAAELYCLREYLGLPRSWVTRYLRLPREGVLVKLEHDVGVSSDWPAAAVWLHDVTEITDDAVDQLVGVHADPVVTFRIDADLDTHDPVEVAGLPVPASWHRQVVSRALDALVPEQRPRVVFYGQENMLD